jgi:hypothetical protein
MTLADLVEEYLGMRQGEPVTIAKLRWLLGKATSVLVQVKLADLSARDIYAWRQTVPEGHRFEVTQALRRPPLRVGGRRDRSSPACALRHVHCGLLTAMLRAPLPSRGRGAETPCPSIAPLPQHHADLTFIKPASSR